MNIEQLDSQYKKVIPCSMNQTIYKQFEFGINYLKIEMMRSVREFALSPGIHNIRGSFQDQAVGQINQLGKLKSKGYQRHQ